MKSISIKIKTENDAFAGRERYEVARILRVAADRIENDVADFPIALADSNGNTVGEVTVKT
jgi:hypothetical protein